MTDRSTPPLLSWGAATDAGRVRSGNEDSFVAESMVFGVADGMGGHQAGEVASAIAATTLRDRLAGGASSVDVAVAAVVEANASIFQGAHNNAEQRGMGTTLTALAVLTSDTAAPRFALLNVGDSRTYVMRHGRLRRVSIDHSYVQELVSTGHITEAEARNHPRRNIVTRALGIEPSVRVDTWVLPLVKGDRYLLCSDGLVDEVDDDVISGILTEHTQPQAAAEALVAAANDSGGRDNTTVLVIDVLEGEEPSMDTADITVQPEWADEARDRLIDADPTSDLTMALPMVAAADTEPAPRSRRGLGVLLFGFFMALIVVATVTLVLVVRHNSSDTPATTTSSSTSSTSTTSTTVPRTTTTAAGTSAPSTSAGP